MVGWHHQFSGQELGQTPGGSEGRKPGVLQSMRLQRVGHDLPTEQHVLPTTSTGVVSNSFCGSTFRDFEGVFSQ